MKLTTWSAAAVLLTASFALAQNSSQTAAQPSQQGTASTQQTSAPAAKKGPTAKTQVEFDAFKVASTEPDATKAEAAATDFAGKYPDSELRPYLFYRVMALYQQANNTEKTLEMARATLKYDPNNPVALITASQILAEQTHDSDLDKDDRLAEARTDAQHAMEHVSDLTQPPGMTPEQFASALAQLRGNIHEVLGTIAYKKADYSTAIKEYTAVSSEEKESTDASIWLRMAVAYDKVGNYKDALAAVNKAVAGSQPGTRVQQLATQEKARLEKLSGEGQNTTAQPVTK